MDLIKTETNSDDEEDPVSHHKEALTLAVPELKIKSDVSTVRLEMACFRTYLPQHCTNSAGSRII
jgi:hypothetical protein